VVEIVTQIDRLIDGTESGYTECITKHHRYM
jgi:hypothetical protein